MELAPPKQATSIACVVTGNVVVGLRKQRNSHWLHAGFSTMRIAANLNSGFSDSSEYDEAVFRGPALQNKILCWAQENEHRDHCHAVESLWR